MLRNRKFRAKILIVHVPMKVPELSPIFHGSVIAEYKKGNESKSLISHLSRNVIITRIQ